MFKHILLATDGSDLAERAASQGLALANVLEARVTAVAVTEPWSALVTGEAAFGFPAAEYEKGVIETAESVLARIAEMAKSTGVDCATIHVKDRLPDEGIIAAAKDNGCDLIVVGLAWAPRLCQTAARQRFVPNGRPGLLVIHRPRKQRR